jgi:hypothetical protein
VKELGDRSVLRSIFFWIETDEEPTVNPESPVSLIDTTFMPEGRAIVSAPSPKEPYFISLESINQLFAGAEQQETRRVTTGTAWLPVLGELDPESEGKRGSVFRIPLRLFHSSFACKANEIDLVGLYGGWGDTADQTSTLSFYSKEESSVFQNWLETDTGMSSALLSSSTTAGDSGLA